MNAVVESMVAACVVLGSAELVEKLCSENAMVKFVRGLLALVLILSVVSGAASLDWDFSLSGSETAAAREELSSYLEDRIDAVFAEKEEEYLRGLLAVAGIEAEKIRLDTDIGEDGSIVLRKVSLLFVYESDAERARALLRNTLGEETEVEVQIDGR